jgi:hypothetical protein
MVDFGIGDEIPFQVDVGHQLASLEDQFGIVRGEAFHIVVHVFARLEASSRR